MSGRLRRRVWSTLSVIAVLVAVTPASAIVPELPPAVLVGAGDIATCGGDGDERTAALLDGIEGTVFTTGDNVYPDGTLAEFNACYDPSWGRHRARTKPSPGNHDHHTPGAAGYFDYFGTQVNRQHWYSYDLGGWHIISLDSQCDAVGGCGPSSPQGVWLRQDLARTTARCIAAYWHKPLFSSGNHGGTGDVASFWDALHEAGADVVINGHDHVYERFARQDPQGNADDGGIRQFTVGTGGASLTEFQTVEPNSEVRRNDDHGVLTLQLFAERYEWEYIHADGEVIEAGSEPCAANEPAPTARYAAVADASVYAATPGANAGSASTLEVDLSPESQAYVRFDLTGVLQQPERAQLRLWVTNGSPDGPQVRAVSGSWSESTVTWTNKPPPAGAALDDAGDVDEGGWLTLDVTSAVSAGGTPSFVLIGTSTNGVDLLAREGATPPELVLTYPPPPPCPLAIVPVVGAAVCPLLPL